MLEGQYSWESRSPGFRCFPVPAILRLRDRTPPGEQDPSPGYWSCSLDRQVSLASVLDCGFRVSFWRTSI